MALSDAAFHEQEQRDFGESLHKARGNLNNCDRFGQIVGTIRCAQWWRYDPISGDTVIYSEPPTYCLWPANQRNPIDNPPLNPNEALKARGRWQIAMAFTGHFELDDSYVPFLGITLGRSDAHINADILGPQATEGPMRILSGCEYLTEPATGLLEVDNTPGFLDTNLPFPQHIYKVPTFLIPGSALPGTHSTVAVLSSNPITYCHPCFGLLRFSNDIIEFDTHYQPVQFLDGPTLSAGAPDVLIWEALFTLKRIFDFTPNIVINQTRFGTSDVESGIFRATFSEVGYNDGNGKVNWTWNFDGTIIPNSLPNISRDFTGLALRNVSATVTDGNGFVYTGSRDYRLKRVDWSYTTGAGNTRNFSSGLVDPGDSEVNSYRWTFEWSTLFGGDSATSTQPNPSFTFPADTFSWFAKLRVIFDDGVIYETPIREVV